MKSLHDVHNRHGGLPDALQHLAHIQARLSGRSPAFFLDFDGTLAPIVPHPDQASLPVGRREVLRRLGDEYPVCIVSGRDLEDLRSRIRLPGLYYASDHGFRIVGPPETCISLEVGESSREILARAGSEAHKLLSGVPGALVETKVLSLSIHYRLTPPGNRDLVFQAVEKLRSLFPELRLTNGKCVFEFRPSEDWGKGRAMTWLLERLDPRDGRICPICVGDDTTDEDMFSEAKVKGLAIVVGTPDRPTQATFSLSTPDDVETFLTRWLS